MAKRQKRYNCIALNEHRLDVLTELARFTNGSAAINGVMPGGTLAALVQMGLVDRIDPDRLGDNRYRVNDKGVAALALEGVAA
jgi:hypothetical protein